MRTMRSPIPLEQMEPAARPIDEAIGLPPACYTDAEFYTFEKAAVFDTEWLCVGRSSQIPEPGDYFTATLVGSEPVIAVRNRDGRINFDEMLDGYCIDEMATTDPELLPMPFNPASEAG